MSAASPIPAGQAARPNVDHGISPLQRRRDYWTELLGSAVEPYSTSRSEYLPGRQVSAVRRRFGTTTSFRSRSPPRFGISSAKDSGETRSVHDDGTPGSHSVALLLLAARGSDSGESSPPTHSHACGFQLRAPTTRAGTTAQRAAVDRPGSARAPIAPGLSVRDHERAPPSSRRCECTSAIDGLWAWA